MAATLINRKLQTQLSLFNDESTLSHYELEFSNNNCQNFSKEDRHDIVIDLIYQWTSFFKRQVNSEDKGLCTEYLEKILSITESLGMQEQFVQVFFLLPEDIKSMVIPHLTSIMKESINEELLQLLMAYSCTNYVQSMILSYRESNTKTFSLYENNLYNLINLNFISTVESKYSLWISLLLNLLEGIDLFESKEDTLDISFFRYGSESTIVSKVEQWCMNKLKESNFQMNDYVQNIIELKSLFACVLKSPGTIKIIQKILEKITEQFEYFAKYINRSSLEQDVIRTLSKLQFLLILIKGEEKANNFTELFYVLSKLNEKMKSYIHGDGIIRSIIHSESLDEVSAQYNRFLTGNQTSIIFRWYEQDDKIKKPKMGISFLMKNDIDCDKDIFHWVLDKDNFVGEYYENWIAALSYYIVNFGALEHVLRAVKKFLAEEEEDENLYRTSLLQVLLNVTPRLSYDLCDLIVESCADIYKKMSPSNDLASTLSMNETLNKFTEKNNEEDTELERDTADIADSMLSLKLITIIQPYEIMEELICRLFIGNFKLSILIKIMCHFPSLFTINISKDENGGQVFISNIVKHYHLNKGSPKVDKLLEQFFNLIIKIKDSEKVKNSRLNILHSFLNLVSERKKENTFRKITVLKIINELLKLDEIDLKWEYYISLFNFVIICQRNEEQLIELSNVGDLATQCIENLLSKIQQKYEVLESEMHDQLVLCIEKKLATWKWSETFYFYDFFTLISYSYDFKVPAHFVNLRRRKNPQCIEKKDVGWKCVFDLYLINSPFVNSFLSKLTSMKAGDVINDIIDGASLSIFPQMSVYRCTKIIYCLEYMIKHGIVTDLEKYLNTDLLMATVDHPTSIALFIMIQCFQNLLNNGFQEANMGLSIHNSQVVIEILQRFFSYGFKNENNDKDRWLYINYFMDQIVSLLIHTEENKQKHLLDIIIGIFTPYLTPLVSLCTEIPSVIMLKLKIVLQNTDLLDLFIKQCQKKQSEKS